MVEQITTDRLIGLKEYLPTKKMHNSKSHYAFISESK
jgi:hypothetical protein